MRMLFCLLALVVPSQLLYTHTKVVHTHTRGGGGGRSIYLCVCIHRTRRKYGRKVSSFCRKQQEIYALM